MPIKIRNFASMKRTFAIFFAVLYFYSASGICINLHYCGGKVESISLFQTDEEGCCPDEEKMNCCKERTAFVKIEDSQVNASSLQVPASKCIVSDNLLAATFTQLLSAIQTTNLVYKDVPPDSYKAPPYLKNRVLLI